AFNRIIKQVTEYNPMAKILGVTVQPMVKNDGYALLIGAKKHPVFGPVIFFGMEGVAIDLFRDYAIGIPPLNQTLARRLIEETKVYRALKGDQGYPAANLKFLEEILLRFSQMLVDFPQIAEVEISPLIITDKEACILDAKIKIDNDLLFRNPAPHEHLIISPYPKKYETLWKLRDGRTVLLRPIKPEDEPLWLEMFRNFSEEAIRFRFFQIIRDTPHEVRVRYCNIDYDREIAIVAELNENGKRRILGVVRISLEPDKKTGEIAFIIADPWQGLGLGTKMVDYAIEIAKDMGVETLYAIMLPDNYKAINLVRKMGFKLQKLEDETIKGVLNLKEEEMPPQVVAQKDDAEMSETAPIQEQVKT
ncbi:GNAT family N-acetyltransferase, partial [Candidatus Bathyarchaeota archaeon]|nr:GNAT family N-acetyltransferase [Candidatus Bathyarchaeota archaeon]